MSSAKISYLRPSDYRIFPLKVRGIVAITAPKILKVSQNILWELLTKTCHWIKFEKRAIFRTGSQLFSMVGGAPGAIPTRDLPLRRRTLYAAELREHKGNWELRDFELRICVSKFMTRDSDPQSRNSAKISQSRNFAISQFRNFAIFKTDTLSTT